MLDLVAQPNGTYAVASQAVAPQGVINLSQGKIFDIFTIPPVYAVTTSSNNGAGAATVTQYLFNNSVLNAAITANGSGASSITNTYGDGFVGRAYAQQCAAANGGRGVLIQGFTVVCTTASTGAQNSTAINTLAMNVINANLQGSTTPVPINVASALRNTQYLSGTYTVKFPFYLNALNQISLSLPADTAFAFNFITETGSF